MKNILGRLILEYFLIFILLLIILKILIPIYFIEVKKIIELLKKNYLDLPTLKI